MSRKGLRICLCGSGGGHLRQLLDLRELWADEDYFFVTEDLALGQSVAAEHRTRFVAHVALGQAKLGKPFRMLASAMANLVQSLRIVVAERPDVVITTGAGSMFFIVLFARLLRAKIVLIDSFARFKGPSAFARIAGPLAHLRIAQSQESARSWGDARAFDPLRRVDEARPSKESLLFATVGATLPFGRLTAMIERAKLAGLIPERVVAQVGTGGHHPAGVEEVRETIPFEEVQSILNRADIVVCHGGTGSLITALQKGCRVISVPRLHDLGEHYDDHQLEITSAFQQRGLVATAMTDEEFADALMKVRATEPVRVTTNPQALIDYLRSSLSLGTGRSPLAGQS